MGCVRSPAAAAMTSNRRRGIDLPLRLLAVVAIARGAGVSKAENVFRFAADATGRATRVLVDHYVNDYLLFGIPAPDWVLDDLTNRKAASRLNKRR